MNKIDLAKKLASSIVGIGTGIIVKSIIQNNVDATNLPTKVAVGSAAFVIGSAASDYTSSYTDAKIDSLAEWWTENVTHRSI